MKRKRIICLVLVSILLLPMSVSPACAEDKPTGSGFGFSPNAENGAFSPGQDLPSMTFSPNDHGTSPDGKEVFSAVIQSETVTDISSPNLAVLGDTIWYISNGMIICFDVTSGEEEAAFPVSELCSSGEEPQFAAVVSGDENVVLYLCLPDEEHNIHIDVLKLTEADNAIDVESIGDATEALGLFFDGSAGWNEVNMTSWGKNVFIQALDSNFMMQLFRYNPETSELATISSISLSMYLAGIPCTDSVLLVSPDYENPDLLEIGQISLTDGSIESLGTVHAGGSSLSTENFAYDENINRLYFTLNSTAYAVSLDHADLTTAIGAFSSLPMSLRLGALAGGRYSVLGEGEDGEMALLSCDTNGQLIAKKLTIADPIGEEAVSNTASVFGIRYPDYIVSVSENRTEEEIFQQIMSGSSDIDAYVVKLNSEVYNKLVADGKTTDLSKSPVLVSAVEDMQASLGSALYSGDTLSAIPLSTSSFCQTLNTDILQELMGISHDDVPTDWSGFLKLIHKMASKNVFTKNTDFSIYGATISAEEFRTTVFSWILQDTSLWLKKDPGRVDRLQKTLVPVLDAFNRVDWYRLGLSEIYYDEENQPSFSSASVSEHYVLMDSEPEIAVMDLAQGEEFWPLSIADGERLIEQTVNVLCVNPNSPNLEAALQFVEAVWENVDVTTKYSLCQSLSEPVLNEDYDDDIAYLEDLVSSYEARLGTASDPFEIEAVTAELTELTVFLDDYRENAYWLITEDSISDYRTLSNQAVICEEDLWGWEDENSPTWQFLFGALSPKQFVKELISELRTPS